MPAVDVRPAQAQQGRRSTSYSASYLRRATNLKKLRNSSGNFVNMAVVVGEWTLKSRKTSIPIQQDAVYNTQNI